MDLSDTQFERYARHLILDEVGEEGQARLLSSRVLVVGAGGLGAPLLLYLAAAGVGTLGVIDDDVVELSNLQRQVIHTTERLGMPKVDSAVAMLASVNPDVRVVPIAARLTADNAASIIADYDLVAEVEALSDRLYRSTTPIVLVTTEIGLGFLPASVPDRRLINIAGIANQILAERAQTVVMMVSGVPLRLR